MAMRTRRRWRTGAALLLVAVPASDGTTAATAGSTDSGPGPHYCKDVDAYRIRTCASVILPATPLGRQLAWTLDQLAGDATSLTEAEVREHVSAEFLTVVMSPQEVIGALQGTLAEQGPLRFVGFSYPPRERQALAIVENAAGGRGAVPLGVTASRPALIEAVGGEDAPPTIVPAAGSRAGSRSAGAACSCAVLATAARPWCSRVDCPATGTTSRTRWPT
jgi:ORF 12 gene product N-terminal